ncbi:MAG: hypothetical protein M3Q75_11585 [Gemmatimonadota bacterium]|nr:hypothetical protein [Gemmatimonadota bacterium]
MRPVRRVDLGVLQVARGDPGATGTGAEPARAHPVGVGEILGYGFLAGEHAHELILTPGTTLHRLLTDPADGRLIERTITAYRPDQAMITQLRATDVFCRAPGCLTPARRCDLDHEHEHSDGGPTTGACPLWWTRRKADGFSEHRRT